MSAISFERSVFVSHASADAELAKRFVRGLVNGLTIPPNAFFFTSQVGTGIESGKPFFVEVRAAITRARLIISLVTPAFLKSQFCLAESGAVWACEKNWTILTLPGINNDNIGSFLQQSQHYPATDKAALDSLAFQMAELIGRSPFSDAAQMEHWNSEKDQLVTFINERHATKVVIGDKPESLEEKADAARQLGKAVEAEVEIVGKTDISVTGAVDYVPGFEELQITVVEGNGEPIPGCSITLLQPNNTYLHQNTTVSGVASFRVRQGQVFRTLCSHPEYRAFTGQGFEPPVSKAIKLVRGAGIGSATFPSGTGFLPGLAGRLNPIRDNLQRLYLYAENIAINGGLQQPVEFSIGSPLRLEDVQGAQCEITFLDVSGTCSHLEFKIHR